MTLTFGNPTSKARAQLNAHPGSRAGIRPRHFTAEEDAAIFASWKVEPLRALAVRLGRGERAVHARARLLVARGQLNPRERFWQPPWTPKEIEALQDHRGDMPDAKLARRLGRTATALIVKAKRLQAAQKANWLTANQVAEILGVDRKKIGWLGRQGVLSVRQSAVRVAGSFALRIEIAELERFLAQESAWYDPARLTEEPWRGMARRAHADPWLTCEAAAGVVGLSDHGFRRYLTRGLVPAVRVAGSGRVQWRVRRSALAGFTPQRPDLVGHPGGRGRGKGQRERE